MVFTILSVPFPRGKYLPIGNKVLQIPETNRPYKKKIKKKKKIKIKCQINSAEEIAIVKGQLFHNPVDNPPRSIFITPAKR